MLRGHFLWYRKFLWNFLYHKNPQGDTHAAIRYIAARRHRGGAKACKPLMSEGGVEVGLPTLF